MGDVKRPERATTDALTIPDHEMLRRIGDGSYGEVWLARSATGALRAVKVVQRRFFDNDKPYEREFNGLLHFEPLSRGHEGLVDVLQVGRSSAGDSFYCVMELADAALPPKGEDGRSKIEDGGEQPPANGLPPSSLLDPGSYQPLTLDVLIRQRGGRLPVKDCLTIASTLAGALQYLHDAGLVHRDIKPSNIIFVGGVPKLADVGLVARADSARTFVGTEGFLPPEGPGTPRADIYSLGKCLYEMAMGKDRQAFPSPPTSLDELPDRQELLELNEVITKACDHDPKRRYACVSQLLADLQMIAAGKSLQQVQRRQRLIRTAVCALCLALLLWLGPKTVRTWKNFRIPPLQLVSAVPLPEGTAGSAKVGDFNGDGEAELVTVSNNGEIVVFNRDGTLGIRQKIRDFRGEACQLSRLADVEGDGREVPVVWFHESTNLFISVFNQKLLEREPRIEAHGLIVEVSGIRKMEGFFTPIAFCQPRGREPAQLLAPVSVGFGRQQRELRCYNPTNAALLWAQKTAGTPGSAVTIDLPGYGRRVWAVGLDSTDNGVATPDGEDDSHSYLHCYDAEGRRLWSVCTGGTFTHCTPMSLDLHGAKALYAMVETREEISALTANRIPASGHLIRVSAQGKIIKTYQASTGLYSLRCCDLNEDGTPEILATDGRGFLHVLDPELVLLRKVPVSPPTHDWVELWLDHSPLDLDADGRPELVFRSSQVEFVSGRDEGNIESNNIRRYHDVSVIILDAALKPTVTHRLFSVTKRNWFEVFNCPANRDGTRDLAVLSTNAQFLHYRPTRLWPGK